MTFYSKPLGERFKDIYRIESASMLNWDYRWNAIYNITICTKSRECYFGDIIGGEVRLSEIGEIANKYWQVMILKI